MTAPISATTATAAPDYPASFNYDNAAYHQSGGVSISAKLPDAYVAHLARTQAKVNLDVADMSNGDIVDRLIRDNDLEATTTMIITEVVGNHILSPWHSYVCLLGTAAITFTDDEGQTHTMTTSCGIALHYTMFVGTADHSGHGQSLGLSPEQIQEMEGLNHPYSVIDYLNDQCEQAPLVITDLKWKIAEIV